MTTKNFEIDFDLQVFGTTDTDLTPTYINNLSDTAVISASAGKIAVNAGWNMTDTGIQRAYKADDDTTPADPTITYLRTDTYVYAAFNITDTSTASAGIVTVSTSTDTTLTAAPTTPTNVSFNDTVAGSAITLSGIGNINKIDLTGIGTITAFSNNSSIGLGAPASTLNLTKVAGDALNIDLAGTTTAIAVTGHPILKRVNRIKNNITTCGKSGICTFCA